MTTRRFEDLVVGDRLDCGITSASAAEMIAFAEQFDPLAMHVDEAAARETAFEGLIASGIHTFALTQPPVVEHLYGDSALLASAGMQDLQFPAPLRPDEAVAVTVDVLDKRVSERTPERGVLTTRRRGTVGDKTVLSLENDTVWHRDV